jgi:hypothetical protein
VYGSLNYSGFCFEEMRYLSDEEKIRGAIANLLKNYNTSWYAHHTITEKVGDKTKYQAYVYWQNIPFKDIDEFLKENPHCCVINRGGEDHLPEFWEKIFGRCNYFIGMKYRFKYVEKKLKYPVDQNVENWEQKRDKALKKIEGHEGKGFHEDGIFTANNCGNFCRED